MVLHELNNAWTVIDYSNSPQLQNLITDVICFTLEEKLEG